MGECPPALDAGSTTRPRLLGFWDPKASSAASPTPTHQKPERDTSLEEAKDRERTRAGKGPRRNPAQSLLPTVRTPRGRPHRPPAPPGTRPALCCPPAPLLSLHSFTILPGSAPVSPLPVALRGHRRRAAAFPSVSSATGDALPRHPASPGMSLRTRREPSISTASPRAQSLEEDSDVTAQRKCVDRKRDGHPSEGREMASR